MELLSKCWVHLEYFLSIIRLFSRKVVPFHMPSSNALMFCFFVYSDTGYNQSLYLFIFYFGSRIVEKNLTWIHISSITNDKSIKNSLAVHISFVECPFISSVCFSVGQFLFLLLNFKISSYYRIWKFVIHHAPIFLFKNMIFVLVIFCMQIFFFFCFSFQLTSPHCNTIIIIQNNSLDRLNIRFFFKKGTFQMGNYFLDAQGEIVHVS